MLYPIPFLSNSLENPSRTILNHSGWRIRSSRTFGSAGTMLAFGWRVSYVLYCTSPKDMATALSPQWSGRLSKEARGDPTEWKFGLGKWVQSPKGFWECNKWAVPLTPGCGWNGGHRADRLHSPSSIGMWPSQLLNSLWRKMHFT